MILYLFFYILATIFSFCYSKSKDKSVTVIFGLLTFMTLFLPLALRYGIGTDYESYVRIITRGVKFNDYGVFELGWAPIIWILDFFNLNIHWFFVFISLISTIIFFTIPPKEYFYVCVPVYICTSWISSFSLVRQSFAALIFLLAFKSFISQKKVQTIFWGIIAGFFHTSLFFALCLLPFCRLKWNRLSPLFNGTVFLLLCSIFAISDIGVILLDSIIAYTPYSSYINSEFFSKTELGSGLGVMLKELILFFFLISFHKDLTQSRDVKYNAICIFALVQGIFIILSSQIRVLGRLTNIFEGLYIFFIIYLFQSKSKYNKILAYFIIFSFFLMYVRLLQSNPSSAGGGMGLTPYRSIFSR